MGSLLRATTLWGYGDLVRELGGDPERVLVALPDPAGYRKPGGRVHLLRCLRAHAGGQRRRPGLSGLRTSSVAVAGPGYPRAHRGDRAERADRARRVRDDRAVPLRPFTRVEADTRAAHPEDRPHVHLRGDRTGPSRVVQGYELSMAIVVRIIRLLGGPEARPSAISFMHDQQGSDAAYRETLGCPVRFGRRGADSRYPSAWPTDGSRARIRRPDASRRNTLSPTTFRPPRRCRNAWRS